MSGRTWAKLFSPDKILLRQTGHKFLVSLVRFSMVACHECPFSHFHQTLLLDRGANSSGFLWPFFSQFHSLINSGYFVAKFRSAVGFCPAQYGQPIPPE